MRAGSALASRPDSAPNFGRILGADARHFRTHFRNARPIFLCQICVKRAVEGVGGPPPTSTFARHRVVEVAGVVPATSQRRVPPGSPTSLKPPAVSCPCPVGMSTDQNMELDQHVCVEIGGGGGNRTRSDGSAFALVRGIRPPLTCEND
jgi:hypothetical protein